MTVEAGFDFGTHPGCWGLLHSVVTESGVLVLSCDEDDAVLRHPEMTRSAPPTFPRPDNDFRIGGGLHLRPGSWRFATIAEVEGAGWEPFLRVELLVDVSGPPWVVPEGESVAIGASTTRGDVRADSIDAYLSLKRDLGGRAIDRIHLEPEDPTTSFGQLADAVDVIGRAIPVDGSEAIELTGSVRWWGPPSPGPAAIG
jgi:hypothetical protein